MLHRNYPHILALLNPKKNHGLSTTTVDLIHQFYQNDAFTRLMLGQKDFISIGRNIYKQKRLLMCHFKRALCCIQGKFANSQGSLCRIMLFASKMHLLGASGTHSVCACTMHQIPNSYLLPIGENCKELMKLLVCNIEKENV